ncbi:MAG: hypothetical protein JNM56_05830 [Planctomycetia bacterium]|nr:hypothetical protein [Planctomycetia bacterium]
MPSPGALPRCAAWCLVALALLGCGRAQPTVPAVVETIPVEEEEPWPLQEAINIKIKDQPDPGKRLVIRQTQREAGVRRVLDPAGSLLREETPAQMREIVALLSAEGGAARKLNLTIQKDSWTQDKTTRPGPLLGRTIFLDQQGNRWKATSTGNPPLPADVLDAAALDMQTRLPPLLPPGKPVQIGERWPLREALLLDRFAPLGVIPPATGAVRLVRASRKDGRQWGRLEFTLSLSLRDTQTPKMSGPCTLDISGHLEAALDASSTASTLGTTVKLTSDFVWDRGGGKLQVKSTTETTTTEERSEEK